MTGESFVTLSGYPRAWQWRLYCSDILSMVYLLVYVFSSLVQWVRLVAQEVGSIHNKHNGRFPSPMLPINKTRKLTVRLYDFVLRLG